MSHLYVHIPFCTHRCGYCDFVATENLGLKKAYLEALQVEMAITRAQYPLANLPLKTIYIGGGTPSALNLGELTFLLEGIQREFGQPLEEYTIEMNPETVTLDKLKLLRKFGINRISLGLQAKQPELLALLERRSDAHQVQKAVEQIRHVGIERLSLDVIYGIPGQGMAELLETLDFVLNLEPDHISCYALKLEPQTPLGQKQEAGLLQMPLEDLVADQLEAIVAQLKLKGYGRYEVSNFALRGFESQHNLAYWLGADTLGLGAGAVYKIGDRRYYNTPHIENYIEQVKQNTLPIHEVERLSDQDHALELLMLRLRLAQGLDLDLYFRETGQDLLAKKSSVINAMMNEGLMGIVDRQLILTDAGMAIEHAIILALSDC